MVTLTGTDDATANLRALTADEIDLVAGGLMFASRTMNVHLGITISYFPGHLSFSHPGIAISLLHTATAISVSAGRLSFARKSITTS